MSAVNVICRELTQVWNTVNKISGYIFVEDFSWLKTQDVYT
jgi:hypothetical protein